MKTTRSTGDRADSSKELLGRHGFHGMICAGIGCVLINRCVFGSVLRFVYDVEVFRLKVGGHDQLFLYEVQRREFRVFLHGDVVCGHLPEWPLNRVSEFDDRE